MEDGQGPDTTHTRSDPVVGAMAGIGDHVGGSNSFDNRASNLRIWDPVRPPGPNSSVKSLE